MCARLHGAKKAREAATSMAINVDEQRRVTTTLQTLSLDPETGRQPVPPGSRIWVEVGANSRNLLAWTEALCPGNSDVYIISFDPLLAQYASTTRSPHHDTLTPLGSTLHSTPGHGVSLPLAVSTTTPHIDLNVSPLDSCFGVLCPIRTLSHNRCTRVSERRRVPSISLYGFSTHSFPKTPP